MKVAVAKVQVYLCRIKRRSEKFADLFSKALVHVKDNENEKLREWNVQ